MNVNISAGKLPLTKLSITFNSSKFLLKDGVEQPGLELPDLGAGRGDVHGILHDSCDSLHDSLVTAYLVSVQRDHDPPLEVPAHTRGRGGRDRGRHMTRALTH